MPSDVALTPNYVEDIYHHYSFNTYQKLAKDGPKVLADWQKWDVVYNGFRIQRVSTQHSHVHILNLDGSPPPVFLMGHFTSWPRAEQQIDKYSASMSISRKINDIRD